jgi:cytochrome d ubiquinol oxidase subunit I
LGFYAVATVYVVLTAMTVYVLRRLAGHAGTLAPQEPVRDEREPTGSGLL